MTQGRTFVTRGRSFTVLMRYAAAPTTQATAESSTENSSKE
jgi:hypothetical protein